MEPEPGRPHPALPGSPTATTVDEAIALLRAALPVEPEPSRPAFAASADVDDSRGNGKAGGSGSPAAG